MALPVAQKTWILLPNQRVAYTSLLATMGGIITGHTNFMITRGFTVAGSSDGTTGAMDGVNRCTTAAGFAVRGSSAVTAQSWIVLTHANGSQTMFAYQGGGDDNARVSLSPGGLFVVAATPTRQPTATDELVQSNGATTIIDPATSQDRVFTSWVDSAHNAWRLAIFRQGVGVGALVGAEPFDASPLQAFTCTNNMWAFAHSVPYLNFTSDVAGPYAVNTKGGLCRTSGNAQTQLGGYISVAVGTINALDNLFLNANGGLMAYQSLGLFSQSAGAVGLIGFRYDWYKTTDLQACGALTPGMNWVVINNYTTTNCGVLFPWDGVTATCVTS